jgi:hypothetical protein
MARAIAPYRGPTVETDPKTRAPPSDWVSLAPGGPCFNGKTTSAVESKYQSSAFLGCTLKTQDELPLSESVAS